MWRGYFDKDECASQKNSVCVCLFHSSFYQAKYTSYDPFVLECVAFIHQQVLACDRYLQLAPEDSALEYHSSMIQCRNTCLQSLHQLVERSMTNIKIAAPELKLDLQSLMGDEDDPRTMPERLFDE